MQVEFECPNHGAVTPKNARKGGLAVDLICPKCGERCVSEYINPDNSGRFSRLLSKEEVYPVIYGGKK